YDRRAAPADRAGVTRVGLQPGPGRHPQAASRRCCRRGRAVIAPATGAGPPMTEQELLVDCLRRLNGLGLTYYLTGSMASNYWGIPRTTHDLDFGIQPP